MQAWVKISAAVVVLAAALSIPSLYHNHKVSTANSMIVQGDEKFQDRKYADALSLYQQAADELGNQDSDIKSKINKAEDKLAAQKKQETDYVEAMKNWKSGVKRDDVDFMLLVARQLDNADPVLHPDVKQLKSEMRPILGKLASDRALKSLTAGEVGAADVLLSEYYSYAKGDPNFEEAQKKVHAQLVIKAEADMKKQAEEAQVAQAKAAADAKASADAAEAVARQDAKNRMNMYESTTGSVGIAVGQVETRDELDGFSYTNGDYEFLLLGVSAKNNGTGSEPTNPLYFSLIVDGSAYTLSEHTFGVNGSFSSVELPTGIETHGWLVFGIPKNAHSISLRYSDGMGNSALKQIIR